MGETRGARRNAARVATVEAFERGRRGTRRQTRRTVGHGSVSYVTDGSVSAFLQIAQSCRFWSPSLPNIHDTTQSHFFTEKNMSPSSARRELFGSAPAATAPPAAESSLIPGSISKQNNIDIDILISYLFIE